MSRSAARRVESGAPAESANVPGHVTPRDPASTRTATHSTLPPQRTALARGGPCLLRSVRSLSITRATDKWLGRFAHACFHRPRRDKAGRNKGKERDRWVLERDPRSFFKDL